MQVYDHGTRVPALFRGPGIQPGLQIDGVIGMVDIAPTILELAGGTVPPEMDGGSFAPLLLGQPTTRRDFTLIEYESIQNAPGQTNEAMGARAATDSTNNTFRAIRWINASAVPPIDLLYAEFTNVLDPAGWHFEPAAVNYHELYHIREDYFMLENLYTAATDEVKTALHEKLQRGFNCQGRAECDAA